MKNLSRFLSTALRTASLCVMLYMWAMTPAHAQSALPAPSDTGIRDDHQISERLPIGFPFKFFGQPQADFVVTTNGLLQFGTPSAAAGKSCPENSSLTQALPLQDTIYALWGDWRTPATKPAGFAPVIRATYGVAPHRIHVLQWHRLHYPDGSQAPAFQAALHENGRIDFMIERESMPPQMQSMGVRGPGDAGVLVPCWTLGEGFSSVTLTPGADGSTYEMDPTHISYVNLADGRLKLSGPYASGENGWTNASMVFFQWQQAVFYQRYQLDIVNQAGQVVFRRVLTDEFLEVDLAQALASGQQYKARVRGLGVNADGEFAGPWSEDWAFGFDNTPPTAAIAGVQRQAPETARIQWAVQDDGQLVSATLTIAADAEFRQVLAQEQVSQPGEHVHVNRTQGLATAFVKIQALDAAGNTFSTAPARVHLAPDPEIITPADGSATASSTLAISGLAWPHASVQLLLNGADAVRVPRDVAGRFSARISNLSMGENTLQAIQTVAGQTQRSRLIHVTRQDTGIVLNLTFAGQPLAAGATITQPGLLSVQAESPTGIARIQGSVNGREVFSQTYGNTSPVTASQFLDFAQLPNGSYTLTVTATDGNGGQTVLSIPFTLNISAPAAPVITSPANGATISVPQLRITGTATPGARVQVFVNGQAVDGGDTFIARRTGNFAAHVNLTEGTHQLTARASNSQGDSPLSSPVSVTYSAAAPTVIFVSPAAGATLSADTVVEASAVDAGGIAKVDLYANNQLIASRSSAPYSAPWPVSQLADGNYTLRAVATNTAGKTAQASRAVTVQKEIAPPPPPPAPYGVRNVTITPAVSFGATPIQISAEVVSSANGERVPHAALRMILRVQGFERRLNLVSDAQGRFTYDFVPQANDAGTYEVRIVHPEDAAWASRAADGSFTINRLSVGYAQYKLNAIRGVASSAVVNVTASAGSGATGVHWQALPADQPSGSLPPGITLDTGSPIDIAAGATAPTSIKLTGSAHAGATGTVILKLFANESGSTPRAELRLDYQLHEARPGLSPEPTALEIGVQQTKTASGKLTLTNKGYSPAQNVQVQLLTREGSAPPAWVSLASSPRIGAIDIGQSTLIQIDARPGADVADGYYQLQLKITADNDPGGSVPVTIAVARDGQGGVRFKMVDIYTGTLNAQGQSIEGLAGARIVLQNEALTGDIRTASSNAQGIAEFTAIPPGNYRWRASAPNHLDASGRITVSAGLTASERVFLDYQVISIEFSVTETTIRDVYDIVLEATYQTQVPAPVVLLKPMSINLPAMQPGEEITGELSLSNYGLVRADDVQFALPQSDENFRYEFFGQLPTQLAAKSRVTIPYRITSLKALKSGVQLNTQPAELLEKLGAGYQPGAQIQEAIRQFLRTGDGSAISGEASPITIKEAAKAASCSSYQTQACAAYQYDCAAGDVRKGSACSSISRVTGTNCTSSSISVGGGGTGGGSGGGGWGGGWGGGGAPIPLSPTCVTTCKGPNCRCQPSP